jgi:hypothetical protein
MGDRKLASGQNNMPNKRHWLQKFDFNAMTGKLFYG